MAIPQDIFIWPLLGLVSSVPLRLEVPANLIHLAETGNQCVHAGALPLSINYDGSGASGQSQFAVFSAGQRFWHADFGTQNEIEGNELHKGVPLESGTLNPAEPANLTSEDENPIEERSIITVICWTNVRIGLPKKGYEMRSSTDSGDGVSPVFWASSKTVVEPGSNP